MSEKRTKADKALRQADKIEKRHLTVQHRIRGKSHAKTSARRLCGW